MRAACPALIARKDTLVSFDEVTVRGMESKQATLAREAEQGLLASIGKGRVLLDPIVLVGVESRAKPGGTASPTAEGWSLFGERGGKGPASLQMPARQDLRFRMRYRVEKGGEVDLVMATGFPTRTTRFTIPADPVNEWRDLEVISIGRVTRCVVDGNIVVLPVEANPPGGADESVTLVVRRGTVSVGATTLEPIAPE